jgi:peptide/nickel transport system ATP-binding protein
LSHSATPSVLQAENITKFWHKAVAGSSKPVLDSVSLNLSPGKIVGLVGESGSGKSTLARVLVRLIAPSSGRLLFHNNDVLQTESTPSLLFRRNVQMVLQDPFASLNPHNTIQYHLERPLLRHGFARRSNVAAQVSDLLQQVGLSPDFATRRPHELSGGQRQRVAIARAIAVKPQVIVADEPTSMLDVSVRAGILNLMQGLAEAQNVAWVYITHDLASARYVAHEVYVLFGGQIVESGPVDAVLENPKHPYTEQLLSRPRISPNSGTRQ